MSGKSPSAGPKFAKSGTTWRVITPDVVLRNTVTDADGDTSNLTFQVYTTDADGTPKAQVDLDGSGSYGVLVSSYVAPGSLAKVPVPYGLLKPGVLYKFRTSAFDGSLYETNWSAWADFRIEPYVKFPAPQTSSTIDPNVQEIREFNRTDPGPALPTEELQLVADEYRADVPDLDLRRDRAARALGLDPAELPSEAAALARLVDLSQGPVAAACLVVGYEGDPLDPLFSAALSGP